MRTAIICFVAHLGLTFKRRHWFIGIVYAFLTACEMPQPPSANLPTLPAVLDITPAPTLDIDATATVFANQLRPTSTPVGLYTVQNGDTVSGLATQFNVTVEDLLAANNLTDPNALQVGQTLIIPISPTSQLTSTSVGASTPTATGTVPTSPALTSTSVGASTPTTTTTSIP